MTPPPIKGHPLSISLFLRRNPGRAIPLIVVLALAGLTIAGVIALLRSIDGTILKIYDYNRFFAAITPRGSGDLQPELGVLARQAPGLKETFETSVCVMNAQTIVGRMPFVIFGLRQEEMPKMAAYCKTNLAEGRFPGPGEAAVALSDPVMRNKGLKLGDTVLSPLTPDQFAPTPVRLVGRLSGDVWLGLASYEFVDQNFYPALNNLLLFAESPRDQKRMDRWLEEQFKGKRARVWTYGLIVEETHRSFRNLYFIINIVVVVIALMLSVMMGMLANIYFQQRIVEFGLLQAIGFTRAALLRRVVGETLVVVTLGWATGAITAYAVMTAVREWAMEPRGLVLKPDEWMPYLYTLPVPVFVLAFAAGTIAWRLRRFDPVAIVERKIV
ncbi:MAG: ABC transporter permease [Armatimonadetes bacterium]|nr:ABC transporter permease [Armatimonadota bacterium]